MPTGLALLPAGYTNNALNQLTGRGVPSYVDIVGAATALATNVSVNSQAADYRLSEYYWKKLAVANSGGPVWPTVTNTAIMSNQVATVTGHLLVPPAGQSFQYDADGNLTPARLRKPHGRARTRRTCSPTSQRPAPSPRPSCSKRPAHRASARKKPARS